jgi:dephospho-CoA kinase
MNTSIPTIGIAGGIGSGKSTIATFFQELGCIVSNADEHVHALLQTEDVRNELVGWWGNEILHSDGSINREAISTLVFNDDSKRLQLESLLHPLARESQEEKFANATRETKALIIDAPLLFEAGLNECCDAIVFVEVSPEIRQKRVLQRREWTIEEFNRRETAQLPLDMKQKKADYIVINEADPENAQRQVEQILEDIRTRQLK